MTRCRHPGCLSIARTGIYCDAHRKARAAAKSRRQREREKERAAKRRKAREHAAIQLLVRLGYSVAFPDRYAPEAFPS